MTRDEITQDIAVRFKDDILRVSQRSPGKVFIDIKPESLKKIAQHVFHGLRARFNTVTAVDVRDHFEMLYHFTFDREDLIVSFRFPVEKADPEVDSLAPLFEGANWAERETHETMGIKFKGHPDLRRLLLPEDWPDGIYPLRRDYQEWDKNAIRDRGV
jgi:NADH-quinone oxidoreductase subunit C